MAATATTPDLATTFDTLFASFCPIPRTAVTTVTPKAKPAKASIVL